MKLINVVMVLRKDGERAVQYRKIAVLTRVRNVVSSARVRRKDEKRIEKQKLIWKQ